MKDWIENYQISLQTVGPVFVGNGEDIAKKEYLFLPGGKVAVTDQAALYNKMKQLHKEIAFEDFLIKNRRDNLGTWLRNNRIRSNEIADCFRYTLECGDQLERNSQLMIRACIKDPYYQPYIPGSSIKGMLRTILMGRELIKGSAKYRQSFTQIRQEALRSSNGRVNRFLLDREMKKLEADVFRLLGKSEKSADAVNDILQGMIVSDSEPLSTGDLVLCQKVDMHTDGMERKFPLLRECIAPGREIRFQLTLDKTACHFSLDDILEAVSMFAENCNESFINKYAGLDRIRENELFLGGGAGYITKTVMYPMFGGKEGVPVVQGIFEKTVKNAKEHKHYLDVRKGVSPHVAKVTYYGGKKLQFGLCLIGRTEKR